MSYSIEQVKEMFKNYPICGSIQVEGSNSLISKGLNIKDSLLCTNCQPRFNYDYEEIYNDIRFGDGYIVNLTYCIAKYDQANLICNVNFSMTYFSISMKSLHTNTYCGNEFKVKMQKQEIIKQINSVIELRDLVYYYGPKFRKANLLL